MQLLKTKNILQEKTRVTITAVLQSHLVDAVDLALQTKNAHWNVKGPNFIALHKFFDELLVDTNEYTDSIAERIVQLGGGADGTIQSAAKKSHLPEYPRNISSGDEHIMALAKSYSKFSECARKTLEQANAAKDYVTVDIFTKILRRLDKQLWMIESHLDTRLKH